jgi:hypothetical protein
LLTALNEPTATHDRREVHATDRRAPSPPVPGLGLETTVQEAPFHTSMRVSVSGSSSVGSIVLNDPTATHQAEEMHATEFSQLALPGAGLGTADHDVPFHVSTSVVRNPVVPLVKEPTAMHEAWVGQTTEWSALRLPGVEIGMMDQDFPFHTAVSPCRSSGLPGGLLSPTATHDVEDVQSTQASSALPGRLGAVTLDHPVPSHASIRPCCPSGLPGGLRKPTARHKVGELQSIDWSALRALGLGT